MLRLSELLERLRPAGTPGAPTEGEQQRHRELREHEVADVTAVLELIVMGRSDMRRPGTRYVGSQTEHLLEFTDIPVLVVPSPPPVAS